MKQYALLLSFLAILLAGCTLHEWKNKDYSFAQGFEDLALLDEQFGASFKQEKLNTTVVPLEHIDTLLEKLAERANNIKQTKASADRDALLKFISIRESMLSAEKNFLLAQRIGDIGLVTDDSGFQCGEAKYILDAAYYYNESFTYARRAQFDLDALLYEYRDVPQLQDLVGLNENKTAFYKSPLDAINKIIRLNYQALDQNCKIRVVTN